MCHNGLNKTIWIERYGAQTIDRPEGDFHTNQIKMCLLPLTDEHTTFK